MIRRTQSLRDGTVRRRLSTPKLHEEQQTAPRKAKKKRRLRLPKYLPKADWDKLIGACGTPRDKGLITVMLYGGLRVSEACALEHGDIDFKRKRIHVRHGKGDKEGYVNMASACAAALHPLIFPHGETREALESFEPHAPLFRSRKGIGAITRQQAGRIVKAAATEAGLKLEVGPDGKMRSTVSPHQLRHSCATRMLESGKDIVTVKEHLRHSSIAVTQIYTHISNARLAAAVEDL